MDLSTELIRSLLPVYMVTVLGASLTYVGLVEGISESTAQITKIFSGTLSDFLQKRKFLVGLGYGMSAFTKPLYPLANSIGVILAARFLDRIGKGIRDAPRDALISDIVPIEGRGASFGLRQTLDTIGAIIGPVLAIVLLYLFSGNIRQVFWLAVIPAMIAVLVVIFAVKEPLQEKKKNYPKMQWSQFFLKVRHLKASFWHLLLIGGLLALARFSEAFLILKGQAVGLPLTWLPTIIIVMNIAYALSAFPAGALSDVVGRKIIILISMGLLIVASLLLGLSENIIVTMIGVIFWGLHMGLSQGLLAAFVADTAPSHLHGFAYGIFYFVCGVNTLTGSILAGFIGDYFGLDYLFYSSTIISLIALMSFVVLFYIQKTE
ncbi:MAG: MFS transporter [Gammaproteobacteria bacterium]|nr:MFS transporter [Gammaproteobacteria bacterium]